MIQKSTIKQIWPFIGHDVLGRQLINLIDSNHLPRVTLFVGPRAVGKSSAARWLAARSLCLSETLRPCGKCTSCLQCKYNQHPNCTIIDLEAEKSIGIEDLRTVIKKFQMISWGGEDRWLLILDSERMTEAAANTMLKFLEEIPKNVNVIMTSSEPQKILPTLTSRASIYLWHLAKLSDIHQTTQSNHRLASRCAGRPGWMQELLPASSLQADEQVASQLLENFITPATSQRHVLKDRLDIEDKIKQEELVVRELLLRSVQSHRRLLWPGLVNKVHISPNESIGLTKKYLARFELSQNLQPRLLYEDLHLV